MVPTKDIPIKELAEKFGPKLNKIKVALFDVDGVLTDGKIFYQGDEVGFNRFFHTADGYGLKLLKKMGLQVGIITGGDSLGVVKRFEGLGVDHIYKGSEDKRGAYLKVKELENCSDEEILYIGDEFFDLPILKKVGFSATTPLASVEVSDAVDYVTQRSGGNGAVREVVEILRTARNFVPNIPDFD